MEMSNFFETKERGLLIGYPLFSHNLAMKPFIEELLNEGFHLDYFNTNEYKNFISHDNFNFHCYEDYKGLGTDTLNKDFSIFKLGLSILASYESSVHELESYILNKRPDFIIHPKFGLVGKMLGKRYDIPTINLTSGFVFSPELVFDFQKTTNSDKSVSLGNVFEGKSLISKYHKVLNEFNFPPNNFNDLFVNKEELNVVMNTPEFQPQIEKFKNDFNFLGMNFEPKLNDKKEDLIYVSLGTVFNKDLKLFESFIKTLAQFNSKVVIYSNIPSDKLPEGFELAKLGKQKEYLKRAKLFITHGGACSILESLFYQTPMIVIPQTIEHEINGNNVVRHNMGMQILINEYSEEKLKNYVTKVYNTKDKLDALKIYNSKYDLINNKKLFVKLLSNLLEKYHRSIGSDK